MDTMDLGVLLNAGSPYLTHLTAAILIVIMFLLFITLLSTAGYFPVLLSITSYTPVIARLKAKGIPFIDPAEIQDLMQSGSVPDCISRLKNFGYLSGVSLDCSPFLAEEELLISWFEEVTQLRSQAPRDAWLFFDAVVFFQEIAKIKRIIRLVHQGHADTIMNEPLLWPDEFTPDIAAKIANTKTIGEAVRLFHDTRYGTCLTNAPPF